MNQIAGAASRDEVRELERQQVLSCCASSASQMQQRYDNDDALLYCAVQVALERAMQESQRQIQEAERGLATNRILATDASSATAGGRHDACDRCKATTPDILFCDAVCQTMSGPARPPPPPVRAMCTGRTCRATSCIDSVCTVIEQQVSH